VKSKKAINRAGIVCRDWWMTPKARVTDEVVEGWNDVVEWRSSFDRPLKTTTQGLRGFAKREAGSKREPVVAQRLKRMPTIVDKLARHENMKVTQMQDIGGCRAIMATEKELRGVLRRIERNWDVRGEVKDYIAEPKPDGYRAVHVVVIKNDRMIEIQLRTPLQHEWALATERLTLRLREGVKFGVGPPDLMRYLRMAAEAMALTENGQPVDEGFTKEFENLRQQVMPYLTARQGPTR
jgi:GTP pyrophosphokinase